MAIECRICKIKKIPKTNEPIIFSLNGDVMEKAFLKFYFNALKKK
jgi:hypothetical protein